MQVVRGLRLALQGASEDPMFVEVETMESLRSPTTKILARAAKNRQDSAELQKLIDLAVMDRDTMATLVHEAEAFQHESLVGAFHNRLLVALRREQTSPKTLPVISRCDAESAAPTPEDEEDEAIVRAIRFSHPRNDAGVIFSKVGPSVIIAQRKAIAPVEDDDLDDLKKPPESKKSMSELLKEQDDLNETIERSRKTYEHQLERYCEDERERLQRLDDMMKVVS